MAKTKHIKARINSFFICISIGKLSLSDHPTFTLCKTRPNCSVSFDVYGAATETGALSTEGLGARSAGGADTVSAAGFCAALTDGLSAG